MFTRNNENVAYLGQIMHAGVQDKNNAYHNVDKVRNQGIYELTLNLIDNVVCIVFTPAC
jgi:hypothetical protein